MCKLIDWMVTLRIKVRRGCGGYFDHGYDNMFDPILLDE